MGGGRYLEGTTSAGGYAPVVVEIEADEAEDGELEKDFPAGHQTAVGVEGVAKVGGWLALLRD